MNLPVDGGAGRPELLRAIRRLREALPEDRVLVHPDRLATYQSDGLLYYRVPPGVVVLPDTADEVRFAVRICSEEGVPIVARGPTVDPRSRTRSARWAASSSATRPSPGAV